MNDHQFLGAWDLLTPKFQGQRYPADFSSFVAYWRETPVEVVELRTAYETAREAKCEVRLRLIREDREDYYALFLLSDDNRWLIDSVDTFSIWPAH